MMNSTRQLQSWYGPFAGPAWRICSPHGSSAAGAVLVAWRNHKAGRTDLRGASRLGAAVFSCSLIGWALTAHHVPTPNISPSVFRALGGALTIGVLGAVLYMAVEPFIRRRWPESLISWTRVLSGRIRDPLVGGHVAIGAAVGIGLTSGRLLKMSTAAEPGFRHATGLANAQRARLGDERAVVGLVWWSVVKAFAICVILLFARVLLRRDWLAIVAVGASRTP